jgi:hypothetical protein
MDAHHPLGVPVSTFIVVCSFKPDTSEEAIRALVPAEQAAASALQAAGRIGAIHIAPPPRRKVFIEVIASDIASAEQTVRELPLAALWDLDTYPVVAPPSAA